MSVFQWGYVPKTYMIGLVGLHKVYATLCIYTLPSDTLCRA